MFKTIFTCMEKNKHPSEEDINKISPYIFTKWLANNPMTIGAANQFNLYSKIPIYNQYYVIKNAFGGKRLFIQYPKSAKDDDKILDVISKHYKISLMKAKEYRELLPDSEINDLIKLYEGV